MVARVEGPSEAPEWAAWLAEIGFLPGESVQVLARGVPGGDPLVVRVGDSTFALRRAEAHCVQVHDPNARPEPAQPPASDHVRDPTTAGKLPATPPAAVPPERA